MIYVRVQNGSVVDRATFADPMPDDWPGRAQWHEHDEAQIGWSHSDGEFAPPEPKPVAPPVPASITDEQFFHAAALLGMISEEEALAAVKTGEIPAIMLPVIDGIPDAQELFAARMKLSGAVTFRLEHPLTDAFATYVQANIDPGFSKEEFFIFASTL